MSTITLPSEVARELGVSVRQLRDIVQHGWIAPVAIISRRRAFDPGAVRALQHRLDKDFLPIANAARRLGQTEAQFWKTWISTGVMRCHRFSRWVVIERADLERAEVIWREAGSASSIAATLNRERWLCQNLMKMGQLPAAKILGHGSKSVRLYKRDAPTLTNYMIIKPR